MQDVTSDSDSPLFFLLIKHSSIINCYENWVKYLVNFLGKICILLKKLNILNRMDNLFSCDQGKVLKSKNKKNINIFIFTEWAPRLIYSISPDVCGCVVCCLIRWRPEPRELETSGQKAYI